MNLHEELKALKERISELEEKAKKEKGFLENGDVYWYVDDDTEVLCMEWCDSGYSPKRLSIGNVFHTEERAEFAVEKLKVEADLRKHSRPFEPMTDNFFITFNMVMGILDIWVIGHSKLQGIIYFESEEKANEAVQSVGAERIKKYIFGVED